MKMKTARTTTTTTHIKSLTWGKLSDFQILEKASGGEEEEVEEARSLANQC